MNFQPLMDAPGNDGGSGTGGGKIDQIKEGMVEDGLDILLDLGN